MLAMMVDLGDVVGDAVGGGGRSWGLCFLMGDGVLLPLSLRVIYVLFKI